MARFVAALIATLVLVPLRSGAQSVATLRIGYVPTDIGGQLFIAKDQGMFARAGLSVELSPIINGSAIGAAIVSGSLDIGYSNPLSIVIAHDKGLPFVILTAANIYRADAPTVGQLVVLKSSPLKSGRDFAGKTVAVGGLNGLVHIAARAWIDQTGGDSSATRFIEMSLPEMPAALRAGRIDAAMFNYGVDPGLGKPGDPFRVVADTFTSLSRNFAAGTWFTSSEWVAKHPALARKFVAVMREAARWSDDHRREAMEIIATNLKKSPEEMAAATPVAFGTTLSPAMIQPVIDAAAKYGVIKARFPAQELLSRLAP
jgi:NitT/TauT family transport system substrate-binding protein